MGLNITDEKYNNLPSLYSNVGEWIDGEVKFSNLYLVRSSNADAYTVVGNTITKASGTWGDDGFIDGMAIIISFWDFNLPNPQNPPIFNKTITYINGNIMYLDSPLAGYPNNVFPTNGEYDDMTIVSDTNPDAADFYFNLIPNGQSSPNSVIDGQVNRFEVQQLAALGVGGAAPMQQINLKSGGLIGAVLITREIDGGLHPLQRNYTITYKFLQWGIVQDGYDPPNYYNAQDDLTPFILIKSSVIFGNPNGDMQGVNGSNLANTGYFNENYNGGLAAYTKDSISWLDYLGNPIDRLDYSNNCTFTAIINAENQAAPDSIFRIGLGFLPLDATIYQNMPMHLGHQILLNAPDIDFNDTGAVYPANRIGYANAQGAQFDMDNLRFEVISPTQIRVTGRVKPINTSNETVNYFDQLPDGERRMILWVQVGDYTKINQFSDRVNVLVFDDDNYDAPTLGVQIPDVISEIILDHGGNDITDATYPNTTTEDDVLYKSEFLLPEAVEYEGVRARIYAHNTGTGEEFTLESIFINFDNIPFVNGIHEANEVIPRNFNLPPATDRNHISLIRKPSIDIAGKYGLELQYGYLSDWRYWLAQPNANAPTFFNLLQPNNGLNKDWQHYDLVGDWIIRISYYTRLNGVDDYQNKQIKIRPYEDDPNVSFNRTFTKLSDNTNPTSLIANEIIEIEGVFTWNNAFNGEWVEFTVEDFESGNRWVISSVLDQGNIAANPLKPIAGATKLDVVISPANILTAKCLIDTSLINVNSVSLSYRVFSLPKDGDAVEGKQMSATGFFKYTTDGAVKQKSI